MSVHNPYEAPGDPSVQEAWTTPDATGTEPVATPDASQAGAGVPAGSTKEVLEWVGGDKEKAQAALDVEKADESPRKGLVNELEKILEASAE